MAAIEIDWSKVSIPQGDNDRVHGLVGEYKQQLFVASVANSVPKCAESLAKIFRQLGQPVSENPDFLVVSEAFAGNETIQSALRKLVQEQHAKLDHS